MNKSMLQKSLNILLAFSSALDFALADESVASRDWNP